MNATDPVDRRSASTPSSTVSRSASSKRHSAPPPSPRSTRRPIASTDHALQPQTLAAIGKAAEHAAAHIAQNPGELFGERLAGTDVPRPKPGPYDKALAALEAWEETRTLPDDAELKQAVAELDALGDYYQEEEESAREAGDKASVLHLLISERLDAIAAEAKALGTNAGEAGQ